jgi:hypothetical protein
VFFSLNTFLRPVVEPRRGGLKIRLVRSSFFYGWMLMDSPAG